MLATKFTCDAASSLKRFVFAAVCVKARKFAFGRYRAAAICFRRRINLVFDIATNQAFNRFAPGREKSSFKFTEISYARFFRDRPSAQNPRLYTQQRLNLRKFDDNGSQIYDRNSNFAALL